MNKKICIAIVASISMLMLFACTNNVRTAKIQVVDERSNSFRIVDTQTGNAVSYQKLFFDNKEVVDVQCTSGFADGVVFAFNRNTIIRNGNSMTFNGGQGLTIHATLKYRLENGALYLWTEN